MELDFSDVDDVETFVSVPEGTYNVRVADVREGLTRDGAQRWGMRLEVRDGDYAGRTAAWDGLTWSERGMHRAKFVLSRLGFDVDGRLSIEPRDLMNRFARVQVEAEEREDPITGGRQIRPRVPYMGYLDPDDEAA